MSLPLFIKPCRGHHLLSILFYSKQNFLFKENISLFIAKKTDQTSINQPNLFCQHFFYIFYYVFRIYFQKHLKKCVLEIFTDFFSHQNRGKLPYCKALYIKKLILIEKWRQSTDPKKMANVLSPFILEIILKIILLVFIENISPCFQTKTHRD